MAGSSRTARASTAPAARTRSRSRARSRTPAADAPGATAATGAAIQRETSVPEDVRLKWIAEAAYYIAEQRGFCGGSPEDDWCQAEAEIDRRLAGTSH